MNSTEVLQQWAERSGEYSPDYYAYYGPNETSELIRGLLDSVVEPDAAILELGCSSGRHLSNLHDHGYENLSGIEINDDAFDVMADTYPDLATHGTFYEDSIENTVTDLDDGQFDAVFSVETLQHIHPDNEWVFEELARITGDLLVTVEHEGGDKGENDGVDKDEYDGVDEDENEGRNDQRGSANPGVNYVNDEFPLYYRNWNRVFAEFELAEVESRSIDQDTMRAFRKRQI